MKVHIHDISVQERERLQDSMKGLTSREVLITTVQAAREQPIREILLLIEQIPHVQIPERLSQMP